MDTPDKAASLADSQLADAVNKDWLLASARSSQLSTELKRRRPTNNYYGSLLADSSAAESPQLQTSDRTTRWPFSFWQRPNETSWLLRNKFWTKTPPESAPGRQLTFVGSFDEQANGCQQFSSNSCSINGHLYDNISYAEPIAAAAAAAACSSGLSTSVNKQAQDEEEDERRRKQSRGADFCFGKFRILLTCYVLLGITLTNYSRNALSLAAVGMIASNVMNRELVDILANDPEVQLNSEITDTIQSALDGSCPVYSLTQSGQTGVPPLVNLTEPFVGHSPERWPNFFGQTVASTSTSSSLETELTRSAKRKSELEVKFKASIKKRIESGDLVEWTPSELGLISSAGSVGNLLMAIPITRMGEIYGPKWIIFAAALGGTIHATFMPLLASCNVLLVIAFQVIFTGLSYGADCVAYTLFAHWLPPTEMAFFVSCLILTYQLGTMMSSFATARILSQGISWSWCFYVPAILCALWTFVWSLIGASEPMHSRLISERELAYLLEESRISQTFKANEGQTSAGRPRSAKSAGSHPVAWSKLASDPNIWAIIGIKFTLRWFFSTHASLMPTFLSSVAHMSVGTIGTMSVGHSCIGLAVGLMMGYLTKSLISRRPFGLSLAATRKCAQAIVNFGLALSLLVFMCYDCNQLVTISSLTAMTFCLCFYVAGALQVPLDLSPSHCGLITSITNTLALGQALGAPVSGLILNGGPKDRSRWRIVWGLAIVMNTLSGLIFILLVDSKPRNYSKGVRDDKRDQDCEHDADHRGALRASAR